MMQQNKISKCNHVGVLHKTQNVHFYVNLVIINVFIYECGKIKNEII